jgi:hypothetical protein
MTDTGDTAPQDRESTPERRSRLQGVGGTPATTPATILEERLQEARRRHAELKKMAELEVLEAEIERLERGVRESPEQSRSSDDDRRNTELQPEKLPEYWGKGVREHRDWCQKAENAFRLAPRRFKRDQAKIAWSAQFLRGTPQTAWSNEADATSTRRGGEYTWEQYKAFLVDLIEDPQNRQLEAAQLIEDAKQKPGQSAQAFHQYLASLEARIDDDPQEDPKRAEERKRQRFWTKLREDVRRQILNYQDTPETRDGIVALATRHENAAKRRAADPGDDKERSRSRPRYEGKGGSQHSRGSYNNYRGGQQRGGRGYSQSQGRGGASSTVPQRGGSATHTTSTGGNNCFNCGKPGHWKGECRAPGGGGHHSAATEPNNIQGKDRQGS